MATEPGRWSGGVRNLQGSSVSNHDLARLNTAVADEPGRTTAPLVKQVRRLLKDFKAANPQQEKLVRCVEKAILEAETD